MAEKKPVKMLITAVAAIAICVVAALLIFIAESDEDDKLILSDGNTGDVYAEFDAYEGMEFGVSFIHSVNKSEVYEIYEIKSGKIILMKCIYSSFGAGVATEIEDGQTLEYTDDGKMIIANINREMSGLSYIVGTISDHVLRIEDKKISLRELCGKNSVVRFEIQ
ncbi:MAG: DUF1850 domain-containing protein [Bacillota bacterium]|nr:DUF1850 domain-containing protein [Bacillota bacterium]